MTLKSIPDLAYAINRMILPILGLPTALVFLYDDPFKWFEKGFGSFMFFIIIIAIIYSFIYSFWEFVRHFKHPSVTRCKGQSAINKKMLSIIEEPGHTSIVSRNMTWASDSNLVDALKDKARSKDLSIFVNEKTPIVDSLASLGANVKVYKGFHLKSRFTIKGYQAANPRLYIAIENDPANHIIYKYNSRDHIGPYLATDIVKILDKVSRK